MATIVLVHGVTQEQRDPLSLEAEWLAALAGGVRIAGYPELADRIWRARQGSEITARMAYYGDQFLVPGMGSSNDATTLTDAQREIAETLAVEWLQRAAERATSDRSAAAIEPSYLNEVGSEEGSVREATRSALNGLAKLAWFAPSASVARQLADKALRQVTRYLTEDDIRSTVQRRVAMNFDADTRVLIGHSLGSVVAFEAAQRLARPLPLLITLGNPLGLGTVVYDRVTPQPPMYPPQVQHWVNIADRNDLIAAEPDLRPMFQIPSGAQFDSHWIQDGAKPYQASFYLTREQTGGPIGDVLSLSRPEGPAAADKPPRR